jgi:hypothetical protein
MNLFVGFELSHQRHITRVVSVTNSEGLEVHSISSFGAIEIGALLCFVLVGGLEVFSTPAIEDLEQEDFVSTIVG